MHLIFTLTTSCMWKDCSGTISEILVKETLKIHFKKRRQNQPCTAYHSPIFCCILLLNILAEQKLAPRAPRAAKCLFHARPCSHHRRRSKRCVICLTHTSQSLRGFISTSVIFLYWRSASPCYTMIRQMLSVCFFHLREDPWRALVNLDTHLKSFGTLPAHDKSDSRFDDRWPLNFIQFQCREQ